MWHGFIDIVFSSHQGIPAIANVVVEKEEITPLKRKLDEEDGKVAHFVLKLLILTVLNFMLEHLVINIFDLTVSV